jgi:amidase
MTDIQTLINTCDGTQLAEHMRKKDIKPSELLDATIARVEKVNPYINAVAEKIYDKASEQVANLELNGPLAGVPTFTKDLFSPTKDTRMTNGSLALGEARPGFDDSVVTRLRKAGMVLLGTSTSPEFGISYSTESTRFGATRNPWNPEVSAGGSSGGSGALVAARVVPFSHGNDGGGSLRVPASCCGIFGLKPTRGRMPSGPLSGEGWGGLGTAHAITLSVRDSAALLDITSGEDLGAPYASPTQTTSFVDSLKTPVRPLKIALIEESEMGRLSDDALASIRHAATLCENLGHTVEITTLPLDYMAFFQAIFNVIGPHTQNYVELLGSMRGAPVQGEELEAVTRIILREKGDISALTYIRSIESFHALGRTMAAFLQDYDVILTPTLSRLPPQIGELNITDDQLSIEDFIYISHSYNPFTAIFNATGQPAMSVPLYWSKSELPLGAHFAARFGDEAMLLQLAAQLEEAQPWAFRIPKINACHL